MIDDVKEVLFTEDQIREKTKQIGLEISQDHPDHDIDLIIVGVLKGASVFTADLIREINRPLELDFMSVSSYGRGRTQTTGRVRIIKDLDYNIADKDIILVEDIVDTGETLSFLSQLMVSRGARSIKIASLLSKRARRKKDVHVDYLGFEIPDEFVVGYGIDYSERYRNLKYIASLKEEAYQQGSED